MATTEDEIPAKGMPEWARDLLASLPPLLERVEAAKTARVSTKTLDKEVARGVLAAVRFRDRVLIPRTALVAYFIAQSA